MYILETRTKNFRTIKLKGSLMIQAGQWSRITEIGDAKVCASAK
jgi:hypothetical protein